MRQPGAIRIQASVVADPKGGHAAITVIGHQDPASARIDHQVTGPFAPG